MKKRPITSSLPRARMGKQGTHKKLFNTKKESRIDAAILLYREGEVTLARAAELVGIHRFEFEAALEAKGISKLVEVDSAEALQEGVSFIKSLHQSNEPTEGV